MNNKKRNYEPYKKVIQKMYLKTLIVAAVSIIAVLFLRFAINGFVGNWITSLFCRIYHVSWEEGVSLYWQYVRQYYAYYIGLFVLLIFLVFFRVLLSGFTSYFDEIIAGINTLADGTDDEINMSEELSYVEDKLQQVKNELLKSTREKEVAEKRKDELVVYLAHDIKTPLTSVIGYLDLLVDNTNLSKEQQTQYLNTARDKALRLEMLINDFFEITRSHVQQLELKRSVVSLAYLVEQVVDEAYPILNKAGKTVQVDIDDSVKINVDAQKIARVFTNLLKNAIYYSEEHSLIHIQSKTTTKEVKIIFSNPGKIEPNNLEHIFDKFYRLDYARQTQTGGAGLGLAIAKEIVQAHQGDIAAESVQNQIQLVVTLPRCLLKNE